MANSSQSKLINLFDYETAAREKLDAMVDVYLASGAADETTLRRNRECFDRILLKPRVLTDVSCIDTRVDLFGQTLDHPILLAPCAYHKVFHPDGEIATARGSAQSGATLVASTFSTVALEDMAKCGARLWFQLYVNPDRSFTRELIARAEEAGYQALCLTVDTPTLGSRDRERRSGFALPEGMERANLKQLGTRATRAQHHKEGGAYNILDPSLTWDAIEEMRAWTKLPIVLKGILSPEDGRLAVEQGASGIIVSNHGGRNLDTVPATIEALPIVAEAVGGRIPVLMDGGIRRGTDIVKAIALGANAVMIGRPYMWGLALEGADGVARVVQILRRELEIAMQLLGSASLQLITREVLWKASNRT